MKKNSVYGIELHNDQYEQLADRIHIMSHIIEDHLLRHPVVKLEPVLKDSILKALEELYKCDVRLDKLMRE